MKIRAIANNNLKCYINNVRLIIDFHNFSFEHVSKQHIKLQ
jgi:hypothetical protein